MQVENDYDNEVYNGDIGYIEDIEPDWVVEKAQRGEVVRYVASCKRVGDELVASVKPTVLPHTNPLANTMDIDNCLIIKLKSGSFTVIGKGAGRWPTTEAVIADLLDIKRDLQRETESIQEEEVCA